ncbi:MAG: FRG domain-containing protein [Bacteroidales bacterium]|nr:FRG domain-containing protein [Bacteroidales bacterium]
MKNKTDIGPIVDNHLNTFKSNLRGRCTFDLSEISENELYAIGQHFGLYTPLLDLTSSPYVGLFFALQGKSKTKKRCLWAIEVSLIDEINNLDPDPLSNSVALINPLTNYNQRLLNQQGLFLKMPIQVTFEELVEKTEYIEDGTQLYQIIFPDKLTEDFLSRLNIMNINNLTLFPDLTGSSLHSNYLMEIQPFLEKKRLEIEVNYDNRKKMLEEMRKPKQSKINKKRK